MNERAPRSVRERLNTPIKKAENIASSAANIIFDNSIKIPFAALGALSIEDAITSGSITKIAGSTILAGGGLALGHLVEKGFGLHKGRHNSA